VQLFVTNFANNY